LRHTVVEEWSRGASPLHRLNPAAKLFPLVVFLVALATAHRELPLLGIALWLLLAAGILAARLPVLGVILRGAVVLPFSGIFALISCLAGDPARATELVLKSYLSALAVILVVATTPLPALLHSLQLLGVPVFLLTIAQYLYRYLFVISAETQHMRAAAAARGGLTFRAASSALAVLFARSYSRAEQIHRAMLARGFTGSLVPLSPPRFTPADGLFAMLAAATPVLLRVAVARFDW
jgi:cobalt/nickel transport system permease protein